MAESGRAEALTGDERLLAELLRGASLVEAAEAAGMPERTARRHCADEQFRARLDAGRRELTALLAAQLAGDAEVARRTLREIAEDEGAPAAARVNAAKCLLSFAADFGPSRDTEARLEELERLAGIDTDSGWKAAA